MKTIGILILALGVGVCAAFGARLSGDMYERTRLEGRAAMLQTQIDIGWDVYCQRRASHALDAGECAPAEAAGEQAAAPAETPLEAAEAKAEEPAADAPTALPTYEEALAQEQAKLAGIAPTVAGLPDGVAADREIWYRRNVELAETRAKLASTPLPGPGARLSGWFDLSGLPFLGGLVLIVVGAVLGRRAAHAELNDDGKSGGDARVDFGVAVETLASDVRALAEKATAMADPSPAERKAVHQEIEALQISRFGPIVEARYQLQNRIGLSGFATVFGPFSGGERWLNRAWSTLADNHWPETTASLTRSAEQLAEAAEALRNELKQLG